MKKTIYIYQSEKCNEPFVYATEREATEAVEDEINYYAEKWGNEDYDILDARKEFQRLIKDGIKLDQWYGTYILDNSFGFYVREIEFPD